MGDGQAGKVKGAGIPKSDKFCIGLPLEIALIF